MLRLGCERRPREVLSAQSQIRSVIGADPWLCFRFPYGDYNQHTISVVNGTGFPVGWAVDTLGWKGTSDAVPSIQLAVRETEILSERPVVSRSGPRAGAQPVSASRVTKE